ncbi:MAG: hypothetical protein ABI699_05455 [Caldimonas sp.]
MIWAKTDAGRAEIQGRALVKDRAQRNLLLIIDGKTSAETLLAKLAGITAADFDKLQSLGLIAPVAAPSPAPAPAPADTGFGGAVDIDVSGHSYAALRGAIGLLISRELGMRGFAMSMVLEEAITVEDLKDVAQRVLKQIGDRKGPAAAAAAKAFLLGPTS